ncbi:MAG: hypothetical protein ABSF63_02900 [Candidatus Bathyarchaeia archaeon]
MSSHLPEQFQREYFDWSREEFANRFVEKVTTGRLKLNNTYVQTIFLAISQAINPSKHEFYRNRGNLSVKIPANGSCSVNTKERTIPFTEQMTLRRILEN